MKIKKSGLALGAAVIFGAVSFASCTDLKTVLDSVTVPEVYYIEYKEEGEDNVVTYTAKGVDANGNCYYRQGTDEYYFAYAEEVYRCYETVDGEWTDAEKTVNADYVKEFTADFDEYMKKSMEQFNGSYKKGDAVSFVERACTSYRLTLNIINFRQRYEMYMDDTTGICTYYYGISSVNDKETDRSGFQCTVFETEEVNFNDMIGTVCL